MFSNLLILFICHHFLNWHCHRISSKLFIFPIYLKYLFSIQNKLSLSINCMVSDTRGKGRGQVTFYRERFFDKKENKKEREKRRGGSKWEKHTHTHAHILVAWIGIFGLLLYHTYTFKLRKVSDSFHCDAMNDATMLCYYMYAFLRVLYKIMVEIVNTLE